MPSVVVCPNCNGQKIVSRPPWLAGDQQEWSSTGTDTYPCPTCDSRGYLLVDLFEEGRKQNAEKDKP